MRKCSKCGFLALRNVVTRQLEEAEGSIRTSGRLPILQGCDGYVYSETPICLLRAASFSREMREIGGNRDDARRLIFAKERDCDLFTDWHQGFTPKEHREMLDLREEREWRDKIDKRDKDWRENQAREDRRWRIIELVVMGIVVTLVSSGVQIAAALVGRGDLLPMQRQTQALTAQPASTSTTTP